MDDFAHLHVRGGHSYGYGVATPEELAGAAAGLGMGALALTDRDGLHGVPRFLKAAGEAGVSPVVGAEVSVEGGGHVVLLAEGMRGYRNLCRLVTAYKCASTDRRRPLCPLSTLLAHAGGLVCLTGAVPFGLVPRLVLAGRRREAAEALGRLREAFGRDGSYVELTDDRTEGGRRRLREIYLFARQNGAPFLATNEVAYLRPRDHRLHETLRAASDLAALPGPEYRTTDQLYLKPAKEMRELFADYPGALKTAAAVAERCAGTVGLAGEVHVPAAIYAGSETPERRLRRLTVAGAKSRYGGLDRGVRRRLKRELSCINALGFAPYFLLAHEAKEIAATRGVPVTGRGSAANSVVAYCLGLTRPEPFANRLLFERFMHEGRRADPPDVDLDLDSEGRDGVRDELMRRYGRHGAAVAATAHALSLRGAVRVAARALGHAPAEIDRLARRVPTRFSDRGRTYNPVSGWEEVLKEPAMRGHPLRDHEKHGLLMELSWGLAGRLWEAGTHNGGLVLGNAAHRLSDLVPLEPSGTEGLTRCQYDKDGLEYAGLPKLDLLGLKMHTALRKAGELASERLGKKVDPLSPPPGDRQTYALIRTGDNAGMFQLESPGQMSLSTRLRPRRFSDLVAQVSLFRPGPVRGDLVTPYVRRRNGLEPYSVLLGELEEILRPTYGVLIYQEQVLEVARAVAGFSLTEGDRFRRAMTKERGPGAMRGLRREFVRRAVERNIPAGKASEVFSWMDGFSVYGFPAAHAASFAELSYASAYMRVHHPAEFFCGLLDSQPMGFYSPRVLLNEARRVGLRVLPPDAHLSGEGFAVEEEGTALRVGLRYCKGLSRRAISAILSERRNGPFASVADLYRRTGVERGGLRNLVKGGFLDALAPAQGRTRLLKETDALPKKRSRRSQPEALLAHPASRWAEREGREGGYLPITAAQKDRMEWEVLSLNVSRHPLSPHREALKELGVTPSDEARRLPNGTKTRAAGLLECLQRPPTKSGAPVYFLTVEDERGLLQATIFRGVYERRGHILHHGGAFLLEGRVEQSPNRGFSFLVERIEDLQEALAGAEVPSPRAVSASGAFVRARRGKKVG